ncbi:Telomerase-binding EST1A [Fusarium pseudoanthophilum]|uniref:Telomerase-binding EST1A n=1 Tax=Fusarium pseudoanthophilum TaxID=48495 RepID=A0A8H5V475_9HYPO|nr:Telomerase-binding EST1A [Fusarium pseudoanthophilum]
MRWLFQFNAYLSILVLLFRSQEERMSWAPIATCATLLAWQITTTPGRRSSHASGYNHIDDREPGSEHTRTPTSSLLNPIASCFYRHNLNTFFDMMIIDRAILTAIVRSFQRSDHADSLASVLVKIIKHHRRQQDLDMLARILVRPSEHHKLNQDLDMLESVLVRTVEHHRQTEDLEMLASVLVKLLGYHRPSLARRHPAELESVLIMIVGHHGRKEDLYVLASDLLEIIGGHSSSLAGQRPAESPALYRLALKHAKPAHGLGYAWAGSSCHLKYRSVIMNDKIRDPGGLNDMSVVPCWGDTNVLPFLHAILVVLISYLKGDMAGISYLEQLFPWKLSSLVLNSLLVSCEPRNKAQDHFPLLENDQVPHPLPEDFALRGQLYAEEYFLNDWFRNDKIDEDKKYFELAWQHLAQSRLSHWPSYPHQRPCFMAFELQNKSAESAEFTVVPSHPAQSIEYSAFALKRYIGHCNEANSRLQLPQGSHYDIHKSSFT